MAENKAVKKTTVKKAKTATKKIASKSKTTKSKTGKPKSTKSKSKSTKSKGKKPKAKPTPSDMGIVIVDDDIEIDQDRVNEERKAYLEEARSQEAFD